MIKTQIKSYDNFTLPPSIISKVDVSRLVNEVEQVDSDMTANMVRKRVGASSSSAIEYSDQLSDFLAENELKLSDSRQRSSLIKQLRKLKDSVPIIHMTFATVADRESLRQVVGWLRESVHPQAVIRVGLQPALIAGVYVRTPNRVHDFSMRSRLDSQHEALLKQLKDLPGTLKNV